jgi:hypothetical protein
VPSGQLSNETNSQALHHLSAYFSLPLFIPEDLEPTFGPRYEVNGRTYIDVLCEEYHTLRLAPNYTHIKEKISCNLPSVDDSQKQIVGRCGPMRTVQLVCKYSTVDGQKVRETVVQLAPRCPVAYEQAVERLGGTSRANFVMSLLIADPEEEKQTGNIEFDEWTGIGVVSWESYDRGVYDTLSIFCV